MGVASHDLRIDLDDDGLFGSADEVTDDVDDGGSPGTQLLRSVRGRDAARLLSPSRAGELSFSLDNAGGDYNPGTGIAIGQACRWQATDPATSIVHPLFRGLLDEPEQVPQSGLQNRVNVRVLGALSTLVGKQVSTALYEDIDTGTAIDHLLDAAGFGLIAEGTTNYWPNPIAGVNATVGSVSTGVTLTRLTGQAIQHPDGFEIDTCFQVDCGPTFSGSNLFATSLAAGHPTAQGEPYSGQFLVRAPSGSSAIGKRVSILLWETGGASASAAMGSGAVFSTVLTTEWQLVKVENAPIAATDRTAVQLYVQGRDTFADGVRIEVTAIQGENKDHRTSLAVGSFTPGYSWSSTPHASASERAAGEARDLTRRKIDTGRTELQWWPTSEITDATRELDRLVASEGPGAGLYEDGSGALVFKNRHAILLEERSNTSNATLSTAYSASEPRLSAPWTYDPGNRDRIQKCTVTVRRREAQTLGEVWALGVPVTLGANEIRSFAARAEQGDPIINAQTPTSGDGDYVVSAGSLTSVTLERTSGLFIRVNLRAGSDGATVTGLRLRGQRVAVVSETLIEDQLGIEGDHLPTYPLDIHPEIDPDDAQQFCDAVVGFYQGGRPRLTLTLEGLAAAERLTQGLSREIHDRVRVVDGNTGIDLEGYVHTIRHEVYSPGRMVTTFEVEEAVSENFATWDGEESLWDLALWGW